MCDQRTKYASDSSGGERPIWHYSVVADPGVTKAWGASSILFSAPGAVDVNLKDNGIAGSAAALFKESVRRTAMIGATIALILVVWVAVNHPDAASCQGRENVRCGQDLGRLLKIQLR